MLITSRPSVLSPRRHSLVEGGTVTPSRRSRMSTDGAPVPGATVNFAIIAGSNAGVFSAVRSHGLRRQGDVCVHRSWSVPSFGTDTVRANIGTLFSNTVEIIWLPFNRPPVANPNAYTHDEDTVLSIGQRDHRRARPTPIRIPTILVLTAALVSGVTHGTLMLNSRRFVHLYAGTQLLRRRRVLLRSELTAWSTATSPR